MAVIADMSREQVTRLYRIAKELNTGVVLRKTQGSLMFQVFERDFTPGFEIVWAAVYVAQYEPYVDPDGDLVLDQEIGRGDYEWEIPPAWIRRFLRAKDAEVFKVRAEQGEIAFMEPI